MGSHSGLSQDIVKRLMPNTPQVLTTRQCQMLNIVRRDPNSLLEDFIMKRLTIYMLPS